MHISSFGGHGLQTSVHRCLRLHPKLRHRRFSICQIKQRQILPLSNLHCQDHRHLPLMHLGDRGHFQAMDPHLICPQARRTTHCNNARTPRTSRASSQRRLGFPVMITTTIVIPLPPSLKIKSQDCILPPLPTEGQRASSHCH